jgi:hypothetical protein
MFNESYNKYTFTHLAQKYVSFYDMIVETMLRQMFDSVLSRGQSPKFRVDQHGLLKWLVAGNPRFQLLQANENIFREINMKETIITNIKIPPVHYRTVDYTYIFNIDPINTPDKDKLGIVQRVVKTVNLNELGKFTEILV